MISVTQTNGSDILLNPDHVVTALIEGDYVRVYMVNGKSYKIDAANLDDFDVDSGAKLIADQIAALATATEGA